MKLRMSQNKQYSSELSSLISKHYLAYIMESGLRQSHPLHQVLVLLLSNFFLLDIDLKSSIPYVQYETSRVVLSVKCRIHTYFS